MPNRCSTSMNMIVRSFVLMTFLVKSCFVDGLSYIAMAGSSTQQDADILVWRRPRREPPVVELADSANDVIVLSLHKKTAKYSVVLLSLLVGGLALCLIRPFERINISEVRVQPIKK